MTVQLNPYLSFRDNAREAMTFYQSVFGGELNSRRSPSSRPAPIPPSRTRSCTPSWRPPTASRSWRGHTQEHGVPAAAGLGIAQRRRRGQLRGYWERLSEGGTVVLPLEKAPWGDTFGMCVDRFGISWMVNVAARST